MADNVVSLPSRGKTYLTGPNRTADATATTSKAIEGIVKIFKDLDYSGSGVGSRAARTGGEVRCILVRNSSGIALLPKMAVTWKAGYIGRQVDGYSKVESVPVAGIVDEWLPSSGVAANDYFWLAVRGPSVCLKESSTTAVSNAGDWVAAITAAASTHSTTAGRVRAVAATTESTTTLSHALNRIGQAMSTSNTSGASTDLLVYLDLWSGA